MNAAVRSLVICISSFFWFSFVLLGATEQHVDARAKDSAGDVDCHLFFILFIWICNAGFVSPHCVLSLTTRMHTHCSLCAHLILLRIGVWLQPACLFMPYVCSASLSLLTHACISSQIMPRPYVCTAIT